MTSGVDLKTLEAKDMLDVIHFYFEEDLMADSKEEVENKTRVRSLIYREMYHKAYKYGNSSSGESYNYSTASDGFIGEADDEVDEPIKPSQKTYIPPTDFNPDSPVPFGKNLDAPLG